MKEALDAVGMGIWSWEIESNVIRWSDRLFVLFERDPGAAPASFVDYLTLLPPEDRDGVRAVIETALRATTEQGRPASYVLEHRVFLRDGAVRWIEGRGRVLVDAQGKPWRITGTSVDITERKRTEERLRRSEDVHRLIGELASDYVYVVDYLNPTLFPEIVAGSFERTTGMTPADVKAKGGWWQVIHPDDHAALAAVIPLLEQGRPCVNEYRITDGLGQTRWLRDCIRPVSDPATGKLLKLMGGVQDITDRKRLEEQLSQAQKLEAVARLSGGIAHDFNNLLSVIMGSVALLQHEAQTEDAKESCEAILEASQRAAELTRSLLVFAGRDAGTPQLVNLVDVVRESLPMLTRAVGPRMTIEFDSPPADAQVRIDRGQAQLLLLNLSVNARDAMPQGGTIRVSLASGLFGAQDGLPAELVPGSYARLSIEDHGDGIAPAVMSRLFEPFFTTKGQGKGTGMGLAACHGIVQYAGGAIGVTSAPGKGATFAIFLPLVSGNGAVATASHARVSPGGTETILLIEDEKQLQRILMRMLSDRGYVVTGADSAEAALTLLETARFDLLVSDVVLPGMHGTELARLARVRWPDMRVLLTSGYTGNEPIPDGIPLLPKPFTADRLANRVREILDGGGNRPGA